MTTVNFVISGIIFTLVVFFIGCFVGYQWSILIQQSRAYKRMLAQMEAERKARKE